MKKNLENVWRGTWAKVKQLCPECRGRRVADGDTCPTCNGEGWVESPYDEAEDDDHDHRECPDCGGSGGGPDAALHCRVCRGTGTRRGWRARRDCDD